MASKVTKVRLAYPEGQSPNIMYPKTYNENFRFLLGENPLVVIGMNPSATSDEYNDRTVNKIIWVSQNTNHDGWIMINIYPERASKPLELGKFNENLSFENCHHIVQFLKDKKISEVWCA